MFDRKIRAARQSFAEKTMETLLLRPFRNNPLRVDPARATRDDYLDIAREAKRRIPAEFLDSLSEAFDTLPDDAFIHDLALTTQVVRKKSRIQYLHGYLLYAALTDYLRRRDHARPVRILETGTARGFSSLCMAKALSDSGASGNITTIDILPCHTPILWNCIRDDAGPQTRFELLAPWRNLVEDHITFIQGYTSVVLQQIGLPRVHFAFLDSGHDYETLRSELAFVADRQEKGDLIVCDDYSRSLFPGVVQAVDEFLASDGYEDRRFGGQDDRTYVVCHRK